MDGSRYFLIRFDDKLGHVAKKPASIAGIHIEMTGLQHILWYHIARVFLQSKFDIYVLVVKCDGLVCWCMGTLVMQRGRMYKFLCGFNFPMRIGFIVFVYMVAADSLKVTMYPFLKSCGIEMRGC